MFHTLFFLSGKNIDYLDKFLKISIIINIIYKSINLFKCLRLLFYKNTFLVFFKKIVTCRYRSKILFFSFYTDSKFHETNVDILQFVYIHSILYKYIKDFPDRKLKL